MNQKIKKCLEFRFEYHRKKIKFYHISLHLFLNAVFLLGPLYFVIVYYRGYLSNIYFFIIAAVAWALLEYLIHRFTLHKKSIKPVYKEHTLTHHFFYTSDCQSFRESKDLVRVFFHPADIFILIYLVSFPISYLLSLISIGFGVTFFTVSILYYVVYELFHYIYHTPEHYFFHRIGFLKKLIRHHQVHHDQEHMGGYNFSLLFPILDIIFKTKKN